MSQPSPFSVAPASQAPTQASRLLDSLTLPRLREDLSLHDGPIQQDGSPTWMIEDPLRGRYFRLGWLEMEMLRRWHLGDAAAVLQAVTNETLLRPTLEEVLAVRQFLSVHQLLADAGNVRPTQRSDAAKGWLTQLLHHYLMVRLPLVNPDRFLAATLAWWRPLLSPWGFRVSAVAGLLGLALVLQQWDSFAATLVDTWSWSGLMSYALAFTAAKVLHELGHAYTAKSLGLRVPRMGLAFVVMFPMLYTDTSETWRLVRRRDRFAVAAAGVRMETMVAAWALLAWCVLPEGSVRSALFFLATTSWVVTLGVNASPFMRFDGYYMLSDATGLPNLHEEAARTVRHTLRRWILGLNEPAPQVQGMPAPPWLLSFGLVTLIYRVTLFVSIALLVYHQFFKALGLLLFAVEIGWFILWPLGRELAAWWEARRRLSLWAVLRLLMLAVLLAAIFLVPWQSRVRAEGWIRSAQEFAFYSPRPAKVADIAPTGQRSTGDRLVRLTSDDLQLREAKAQLQLDALNQRLLAESAQAVQSAVNVEAQAGSARSTRELWNQRWVELKGAGSEGQQLALMAPFPGQWVDVPSNVIPGSFVNRQELLGRYIDSADWVAEAFVDEDEVKRLEVGASAKAYFHDAEGTSVIAKVVAIDDVPLDALPHEMLAGRHGGYLQTVDDASSLRPRRSLFRVRMHLSGTPPMQQARLAAFSIVSERSSLGDRLWRSAVSSLIFQANF
jgi:putative peptide zinc metalloprotease protein